MKKKIHMIISLDAEKDFHDKGLERSGITRTYINILKEINYKQTANIKLNGEKLKGIPLNSDKATLSHHISLIVYLLFWLK